MRFDKVMRWLAMGLVLAMAFAFLRPAAPSLLFAKAAGRATQKTSSGQMPEAPPSPAPDERYKADILLVVAHPDDETAVTGYLARAIFDEHQRVAAVFGTRGDGGGNAMGYEQAASLGAVREIEARRALAYFGVMNVWFLNGPDTPGQDVLRSLETWNHGASLAAVVRLVRLTRPEVILTWLPAYVAGENHDDHQAAGVIATEAFDMAGDPTAFPEQVSAPRNRSSISNLTEGLRPWQPKKIYYFSDASHTEFQEGKGPKYSTLDISPARKKPYYLLMAEEMEFHLTQGDTGQAAKQALAKGDFRYFQEPVQLIRGKSLVKGSVTGDVLEGLSTSAIPFSAPPGYRSERHTGLWMELGGPWAFYRDFWRAHGLEHLSALVEPEASLEGGEALNVPITIHNDTDQNAEVALTASLPSGWREVRGTARYPVAAHDVYPVQTAGVAPSPRDSEWFTITWKAEAEGKTVGTLALRVNVAPGSLPQ